MNLPALPPAAIELKPQTVVIVTALDVETKAVLRHLGNDWTDETVQGTVFYRGTFEGWNVAVVEAGPGNTSTAILANRGFTHYGPDMALFVGVGGGVKDVSLGDVVVGSKVYGYESGKDTASGFRTRPDLSRGAHALEQRARAMSKRNQWRQRLNPALKHREDPELKVGPIAAGEKVVASLRAATAKFLKKEYGDTIAVEMEGRGFLEAAHVSVTVAIVIRGISDRLSGKAVSDKDGWQPLAADAASAVAFELLSNLNSASEAAPAQPRSALNPPPTAKPPAYGGAEADAPKPDAPFLEAKPTLNAASFFDKDEVLARVGVPNVDEVQFHFEEPPDCVIRVIPHVRHPRPIPLAELREKAAHAPLLKTKQYGALAGLNAHGAMAYDPGASRRGGPAPLAWATQLFPSGELWLASNTVVVRKRGERPAWVPIPFIPALLTEQLFHEKAHAAIEFAASQLRGMFPCDIELGILGLKGAKLAIDHDEMRGPIQRDAIIMRRTIDSGEPYEIDDILLEFFEELHDATGYARPKNLFHFPPDAPRGG